MKKSTKPQESHVSSHPSQERVGKQTQHTRLSQLEAVFQSFKDGVVVTDMQGNILLVNQAQAEILKFKNKEFTVRSIQDSKNLYTFWNLDGEKVPYAQWPIVRILHGESLKNVVLKGRSNDSLGEWYFSFSGEPIRDETGKQVMAVIIIRDVTEQMHIEEALLQARDEAEQQKRLYEAVTGSTPDLIYVFDLNARFTYANKALLEMWGKTWEESAGKSLLEIGYEPWHAEMHEKEIKQILKTKQSIRGEVSFPHAKLGKRVYDYIFVPVLNKKGDVVAIAGTTRDITDIKEVSRQKDEFLGIASHELKTPVTSIKAYGQVLQRIFAKEGNQNAVKQLEKMDAQINKLNELISDLLDVTKIQSGRLIMQEEEYDLNTVINEVVDELQLTTDRHTLVKQLARTKKMYGDKERLGQVLTNLITNAIKYSPHTNKIIIKSTVEKNSITLCVQDFGVGIPKDKQEKVFEQFFRVSGEKQHTFPGLGLGLYISSEIIKRQGGKIWVESHEGKGSTFCISLPQRRKPTEKLAN